MKPIFLFTKNILLSPFLDLFYNIIIVTCYSSYNSLFYYYKIHRVLRINVRVPIESKLELNFLLNIAEICLYFFKEYLRFRFNRGRRGLSRNGSRTTGTARLEIMSRSTFPPSSIPLPPLSTDRSFLSDIDREEFLKRAANVFAFQIA